MTDEEIKAMTDADLEDLRSKLSREQYGRTCQEFLAGHQSCDQGNNPHSCHGYTYYDHKGRKIRISWHVVE